ncbi:TPA: hypothetical protein HIP71_004204 [Escherichia coli]|nr:hypothetical protein [Escherichia coli]HAI0135896.1 hypothetical protein [Escherichia coli]
MAAAAGLEGTAPTNTLKTGSANGCRIKDLKRLDVNLTASLKDSKGRKLSPLAWLFDEPTVYKMLLRGHAPQSEPFRKWITEEVLPFDGQGDLIITIGEPTNSTTGDTLWHDPSQLTTTRSPKPTCSSTAGTCCHSMVRVT